MKKVFLGSFITVISVLAILAGIYYYQKLKSPRLRPIQVIPANAALIFEVKNVREGWKKIRETKIWEKLSSEGLLERVNADLSLLDSMVVNNKNLDELLINEKLYISAHSASAGNFDLLFMTSLSQLDPEDFTAELVKEVLKDRLSISKRQFEGYEIIEILLSSATDIRRKNLSYAVSKGILVASFTSHLLESTLRKIKKTEVTDSLEESFSHVYNSSGSNVEANIFVNYKYFPGLFAELFNVDRKREINDLSDFASWSEFDLKVKEDAISLSGLTTVKSEDNNYLNVLSPQIPQTVKLTAVLPYNTALMMFWGISDFKRYYTDYKAYLSKLNKESFSYKKFISSKEILQDIQKSLGLDVSLGMLSWIGNEIAMVTMEPTDSTFKDNSYAVIAANNIENAKQLLGELAFATTKDTASVYNGYDIQQVKIKNILNLLLGKAFDRIENCYYTTIGNYVVFANTEKALKIYLDEVLAQRVLSREENYNKFKVNLSEKASFYFYANVLRGLNSIKEYVSDSTLYKIDNGFGYFSKFNAIGLQYISNPSLNGFYNTLYLQSHNEEKVSEMSETKLEWANELEAEIINTPQFVDNHITGEKEIIFQDKDFNLYLINKSGKILWKKKMPSKIMGQVYQIDLFKNKKLQYLFNTKMGLHLITRDGDYVDKFPVKFPSKATNALSVFDYDKHKEYRIFVACENNKIYGYKGDGKPLEGWELLKPVGKVTSAIQHFRIEKKDYLIISESKGAVYITDRKGAIKAVADKLIFKSKNNKWEYDFADQHYFVCTDSSGNIFNLYLDGKTIVEHITVFSPNHYFMFRDVNGDNIKDYIFLDRNKLSVTNQDTSKIFTYEFSDIKSQDLSYSPSLKWIGNGENPEIAVVSPKSNQIYIFNSDGALKKDFPVKGSSMFEVTSLSPPNSFQKNPKKYFATASGKKLYFYSYK